MHKYTDNGVSRAEARTGAEALLGLAPEGR
jgi:hypothetical protein